MLIVETKNPCCLIFGLDHIVIIFPVHAISRVVVKPRQRGFIVKGFSML